MDKINIKFMCCDCGKKNSLDINKEYLNKKKIFYPCCNCGLVNHIIDPTISLQKKDTEKWLECIPYVSISKCQVTGRIGSHDGNILWVDSKGQRLSREKFMIDNGYDPWVLWCNSNPNDSICKEFPNRCKKMGDIHEEER
jgi:hypothetical protein